MADEFGQRIQGLHQAGDTPVATDRHIAVFALDDNGDYEYLTLDATGQLRVTGGGGTQYAVDDVAGATDTGTLALVVRDDALTTLTPADGDYVQLRVNSTGALWVEFVNTTIAVTATDLDIRDLTQATDSVAIGDGTSLVTVNADNGLEVHVNNSVTVTATDLDIRDLSASQDNVAISDGTDTLAINADGSINVVASLSAPDSVYVPSSANLVKDTITTVVTTSPGADQKFGAVMVSGAGYCEWTLEFGTTGGEAVILQWWTTPSNPTQYVDLPDYITVSSGETIRVRGTNREKKASPGSDFTGYATLIRSA